MTGRSRRVPPVAFLFLLVALLFMLNVAFTVVHAARDEHHWCAVLRDPASAAQARDFALLARKFGCP